MQQSQPSWNVRIIAHDGEPATAYARTHRFTVGEPLSFDQGYGAVTALEYILSAIGADLVGNLQVVAKQRRVSLENVEAAVSGALNNPLIYLGVVGEEGHPGLQRVAVTLYIRSSAEEAVVQDLWPEALRRSPLYQTFKDVLDLTFNIVN